MDFSGLESLIRKGTKEPANQSLVLSSDSDQLSARSKGKKELSPLGKMMYRILGVVFTVAGVIGIVVPVWPTTVFLILASAVFLKSSPSLYQWLHRNRILGPYLQAYTNKTGISMGYKIWTISVLWLSIGFSAIFAVTVLWVRIMLFAIALAVTIHVATLKTRKKEDELASVDPLLPPVSPLEGQELTEQE